MVKMAKLVAVYRSEETLSRRQLPLIIDENLTMVMDLNSMGLVCDNKQVRGKELDEFTRKMSLLTTEELKSALQVTRSDMLRVLNQAVPCVGCRRSVERLFYQLFSYGHPTLDPIVVTKEGIITIRDDKMVSPQILCTLFHGHSSRLNNLVDSQPRRSKKSHRCLLHSLDSQRSRPLTSAWRDVWECMRPQCKDEVVLIESSTLHATLENYLRKHRFCGECRTKVLRAYTLLVEEQEPQQEKGYVAALYSGIKRCLADKHIHLQTKTDYITKLISRAEPELLGSRRERHAKTLEIAQEEVLTCLGICVYERLHRIYMRMREEECTCQVFAAVAVDTLCRSFETAVERKQGISQLELLYEELTKEEQLKQQRKEQKKLKRRRRKERLAEQDKDKCNSCVEENEICDSNKECTCVFDILTKKEHNCKQCLENKNQNELEEESKENWFPQDSECKCPVKDKLKKNKKKAGSPLSYQICSGGLSNGLQAKTEKNSKEGWSSSEHSHDCGYSSENNNGCCETTSGTSSIPSSPEGSELACSDSCCHHYNDYRTDSNIFENSELARFFPKANGFQFSLTQMLDREECCSSDEDGEGCYISAEEVLEFKSRTPHINQQRQELRQNLKKKFAQLCTNGTMCAPRPLAPVK